MLLSALDVFVCFWCVVGNEQDVAYFMLKMLLWQQLKQGINCDDVVKEELSIQYSICRLVMVWYNVMCHIAV